MVNGELVLSVLVNDVAPFRELFDRFRDIGAESWE